jgi:integrase
LPDYSLVQIRTSPNWYIQWFEDGHSQRASTRTTDREQAEAVLAAFRLVKGEAPVDDLTVTQVLEWYWQSYAEKQLMRPDSADLAIRNLRPFFGNTLAADCGIHRQQAYVDYKRDQGYGEESIRRDLSVLSAAMNRAQKHAKLSRAPAMLTLTPAPPRERWMTRKEVAAVLRQLRNKRSRHVLVFTRLALYTGARTGAILDLTWDRVNFDTGLIDYRKPGRRPTKKARVIAPMTPALRRMLLHTKKHSRSTHVVSWAGERIDRVAKAFISNAEKVGVKDVSPHVLRHTFASWAVQKRIPIYTVGKALGQTVASTTARYAKLAPDDIADVMNAIRRK